MFNHIEVIENVVVSIQSSKAIVLSPTLILVSDIPEVGQKLVNAIFEATQAEIGMSEEDEAKLPKTLVSGEFINVVELKVIGITVGSFSSRFTLAEKVALEQAAENDYEVRVILKDFDRSKFIDLTDLELQWGLALFVQKNLLTIERLNILIQDGTAHEAF